MSAIRVLAASVEVGLGILAAPLLPGLVQQTKARLVGRRGASALQPYRELRRLWSKTAVTVDDTSVVYRLAPAVMAASLGAAILIVPVVGVGPDLGLGHDFFLLLGLLALGRFALTAAAWDTSNGFALMGASRDLMISVSVEATLVLALGLTATVAGSTDLGAIMTRTAGPAGWTPVAAAAAVAYLFVVVAETGRQPVDNPDTHLELTMIHEGPLLEYAGRDLALLQWSVAARHWVMMTLAATVFLPHPQSPAWQLALLPFVLLGECVGLAVIETLVVKLRIYQVPRLLATAATAALVGFAIQLWSTT